MLNIIFKSRWFSLISREIKKLSVICGHYGTGKTNFAVNLALKIKDLEPDSRVSIADYDIVNPYFRTADCTELLAEHSIHALIPEFANSNVDIPSLPRFPISPFGASDSFDYSIIDVGGDDGAVALGMYNSIITSVDYDLYYVVNMYRPLIADPADALECMREIESASGLRCTKLINNSSLGVETTSDDIIASVEYAKKCAELCGIPLVAHTYCKDYVPEAPQIFERSGYGDEPLFELRDITKKLF